MVAHALETPIPQQHKGQLGHHADERSRAVGLARAISDCDNESIRSVGSEPLEILDLQRFVGRPGRGADAQRDRQID